MKTNRVLYTLILSLVIFLQTKGQEVLIDEQPVYPSIPINWGPNRTNHLQLLVDFGRHLPVDESIIPNKFVGTYNLAERIQYKRKLNPVFSFLLLGGVEQNRMALTSFSSSPLSPDQSPEKEWLRFDWASSMSYLRINFDKKRGNFLGNYCDIGVFYNYLLASRDIMVITNNSEDASFNKQKTIMKGIHDINKQRWGFALRLGFNTLALQYLYQLSEPVFTSNTSITFPLHQLGITFAIPR